MNEKGKSAKFIYYGLISTFILLYLCVAFVSTLHAITFFKIANTLTLAIFLGAAFEIGQASVLFSILMTRNKHQTMAWMMMFLLTTLQITANVFASFKFMDQSGTSDWTYWQRSILFWLEADSPEIYKITIAWITGALLPIVALGLTALAADNIKLNHEKVDLDYDEEDYEYYDDYDKEDEDINPPNEALMEAAKKYKEKIPDKTSKENGKKMVEEKPIVQKNISFEEDYVNNAKEQIEELSESDLIKEVFPEKIENTDNTPLTLDETITNKGGPEFDELSTDLSQGNVIPGEPFNKVRGWNLKKEFIDKLGHVWEKGKYSHTIPTEPKKA